MKRLVIVFALVVVTAAIAAVTASAAIVDSGNDGCKAYHSGIVGKPILVFCGEDSD